MATLQVVNYVEYTGSMRKAHFDCVVDEDERGVKLRNIVIDD